MPNNIENSKWIFDVLKEKYPFLEKSEIELFLSICTYSQVKNKEIIIKSGQKSKKIIFILEGTLRGYYSNKSNEEINIFLRHDPTFFGAVDSLFSDKSTHFTIEAILPAKILTLDIEDFERLAFTNQAILKLYLNEIKIQIGSLVTRIEWLIDKHPQERYEELLRTNPRLFQTAFNKHIANFLGITPVSLSRIIKRIKEKS